MTDQLKPWYAVAVPHEDIRKGRLEEAVFAANLWSVVQETAPPVYLDPEEFFRKTYLTAGLVNILRRVGGVLSGKEDSGDRIISLQTAFGGGKTHTLVALWHFTKYGARLKKSPHAEDLRKALGDYFPKAVKGVAVFTNSTCDVTQGRKTPEGIRTRTIWGEIALQLGGKALYEKVRANDETQRVPQGIFADILRASAPCLILLDELADYCVGAAAVPVGDTTLADQTISFIQQLSEAVQQIPGAFVVATLPASKYEVAQSERGQEAFITLEKRFQRLGADVKPVADEEIYGVVRTRLFESVAPQESPDYPRKVAEAYQQMYSAHSGEVPTEAAKNSYRDEIERAYPFHPLLIDAFYTRWGSHPDFQRTRGVLRLLASIVGDLWQRREGNTQIQHLIQPCHIRWSLDALQAALTRYWGPAYQAVAAADAIGEKSNAMVFDDERGGDYRREGIGAGLASAIMLGSFGGQGGKSGFSSKELRLACSRHGLNWNYTDGAILELENRCFYLHTASAGSLGKRYWFGTRPTLNKLVIQYRMQNPSASFDEEILEDLRKETEKGLPGGATWRILVNPGEDLPEQKSLTLLVLSPVFSWQENGGQQEATRKRVIEISNRCGGKERHYRNTLIFLAASARGLNKLRTAYRELIALEGVKSDYGNQLDDEQRKDIEKRIENASKATQEALGPAYTFVMRVRGSELEVCPLPDARRNFQEHLGYVWNTLVEDEEWILRKVGPVTLRQTGLILNEGALRLKDGVEAFLRFTDKPMIATREAVTSGLAQACLDGLVGIARGSSPSNLQARYCRQSILLDPNEDGVWITPPFAPEPIPGPTQPVTPTQFPPTPSPGGKATPAGGPGGEPAKSLIQRFSITGSVPLESYGELFRCFVSPAAKMNLKKLKLGVQFEMEAKPETPINPNDPAVKAMAEAAKQLGLTFQIDEKDQSV